MVLKAIDNLIYTNTLGKTNLGHSIILSLLSFSQTLDFQLFCSFQEGWQLILSNIDFSSIHELQNCCQVLEWNILQDDDWMLGRILFQQVLEVRTAGAENHLVSLGVLSLSGNGNVTK